jgi:hypothetical protein
MRNRRKKFILFFILAPVAFALFVFVGGEVVRRLWNWLLPTLFSVPEITFWQALGLLVLCRILFGGFGMHGRRGPRRWGRWEDMTPEERERFRQRMRGRWHMDPATESKGNTLDL